MTVTPNLLEWMSIVWFAIALPAAIAQHFGFLIFLYRVGAHPRFVLSNNPIYLRRVYRRWCRESGREPDPRRLKIGLWLQINLLVAGVVFWITLAAR